MNKKFIAVLTAMLLVTGVNAARAEVFCRDTDPGNSPSILGSVFVYGLHDSALDYDQYFDTCSPNKKSVIETRCDVTNPQGYTTVTKACGAKNTCYEVGRGAQKLGMCVPDVNTQMCDGVTAAHPNFFESIQIFNKKGQYVKKLDNTCLNSKTVLTPYCSVGAKLGYTQSKITCPTDMTCQSGRCAFWNNATANAFDQYKSCFSTQTGGSLVFVSSEGSTVKNGVEFSGSYRPSGTTLVSTIKIHNATSDSVTATKLALNFYFMPKDPAAPLPTVSVYDARLGLGAAPLATKVLQKTNSTTRDDQQFTVEFNAADLANVSIPVSPDVGQVTTDNDKTFIITMDTTKLAKTSDLIGYAACNGVQIIDASGQTYTYGGFSLGSNMLQQ